MRTRAAIIPRSRKTGSPPRSKSAVILIRLALATVVLAALAALSLSAQQTSGAAQQDKPGDDIAKFSATAKNVLAPTTVLTPDGHTLNGLKVSDFALYDNDKLQRIQSDVIFQPISLVVAIQANAQVDQMIPKIRKIGAELDTLILGDSGEAAVIAFDHRVRVLQEFTSEHGKIDDAIKKISVYGSSTSRLNDACMEAMNMLRNRPKNHRRILLLISETRDGSSSARPRDVLLQAQFSDVMVYTINISHWIATITRTPPTPRPDPFPADAHHVPAGGVSTPTTQAQMQLGNVLPAFVEIFKGVKGIFVDNPSELLTKYTGGREYTFMNQASIDRAVSDIGDELHGQYLLSYEPSNEEGGFHHIRVDVMGRPNLKVRTRYGYWRAGPNEGK